MASGDKMADFYPLIVKAVSALAPDASGESRRVLYDRVRAALLSELRMADPPFAASQIMHERLALEDAVGRVEEEAVQRGNDAPIRNGDLAANVADPIAVEAPLMILTGGASGRFDSVWRFAWARSPRPSA
jgi:hypothetical protein